MLTITPYYEGVILPEGYEHYIYERNGGIAKGLADVMDMPFSEQLEGPIESTYPLLPQPVLRHNFHTDDPLRFYGSVVNHEMHGTKGILQKTLLAAATPDHLPGGREPITDLALPGYLVFNEDQAVQAFQALQRAGYDSLRLKDPTESDANGQYVVLTEDQLRAQLSRYSHLFKREIGMVIEANLRAPQTISVGETLLPDGSLVSFVGEQRDLTGGTGFAGIDMLVSSHHLDSLVTQVQELFPSLPLDINAKELMEAIHRVRELMGVSRLSFDVISGETAQGRKVGITDITTRVGGTCPGVVEALKAMKSKGVDVVHAAVQLDYAPFKVMSRCHTHTDPSIIRGSYLDQKDLRISTTVKTHFSPCPRFENSPVSSLSR